MNPVRFAVACLLAGSATLSAQEIFWDGFDQGDLCAWSNPPAVYQEQEAFDESGQNDIAADAEIAPARCVIIEGTIGAPYDPPGQDPPTFDTDYYELPIQGPALVGLRLERFGASSEFVPYAEIWNTSQYEIFGLFPFAIPAEDPTLMTREIFLPENGFAYLDPPDPEVGSKDIPQNNSWYVFVDDDRNYLDKACPCGDELNRYRLTVTIESVAGPVTPFPFSAETVTYPGGGDVLRYRVPTGVTNLELTETILDRLNPFFADLDSKIYIVRRNGSNLETVKGDDDFAVDETGELLHVDSQIGPTSVAGGPHFVVVDYFWKSDLEPMDIGLTVQYVEP